MGVSVVLDEHTVRPEPNTTLYQCAETLGVRVPTSCFSQGKCRECLVEVTEGEDLLTPRSPEEEHLQGSFRLSCRARTIAGTGTICCSTLRRGALRIEEEAHHTVRPLDPSVERPTASGLLFGAALDLGTTAVVVRLHDLASGEIVATQSFENPQRFGGSDVMARIRYDSEHPGRLLRRTLLGYLGHALEAFPCRTEEIVELVVAGNSTMRDLMFGLDVSTIGVHPYRSLTELSRRRGEQASTHLETSAKKLRLPMQKEAVVYGLPLIASHVGADIAAGLLACGFANGEDVCVLMDIGTNTEIVVGNRNCLLAASCPAGPAFEGGAIRCGMPALTGAIERVQLGDDGSVSHNVIGGGAPKGICGSGLVDLLGELARTGQMNPQGRFDDDLEGVFQVDQTHDVSFSEHDVNELAQAKGATIAGLRLVLREYGVKLDEVAHLYLAGGFARHLDLDAARRIGLLPSLPDERIIKVGNAALEGASRVLLSIAERRRLEQLVLRIGHLQLETQPDFFDVFVDGCQFTPVEEVAP